MTMIKSDTTIKVLFVVVLSISLSFLTIILLNPLFFGPEQRTVDSALSNISKAMLVSFISLIAGIISILKLKEKLLRLLFNSVLVLLLVEIIFPVLANLNNWWRT